MPHNLECLFEQFLEIGLSSIDDVENGISFTKLWKGKLATRRRGSPDGFSLLAVIENLIMEILTQ